MTPSRAVLYHHGIANRPELDLMRSTGRDWLGGLSLPAAAREQVTVALALADALDAKLPPMTATCAPTPAAKRAARRCKPTTGSGL